MDGNHRKAIEELRNQGFAVTVFSPEELAGVDPDRVEERLVELGNQVIETLAPPEPVLDVVSIKTTHLCGAALAYAVSRVTRPNWSEENRKTCIPSQNDDWLGLYRPDLFWETGGPLIEENKISLSWRLGIEWEAMDAQGHIIGGPTALVAAMRMLVWKKLGPTVSIPGFYRNE